MTSFDPIIRIDENAFRVHEKMQSKAGRKPLTDMTNSRKPLAKGNSSVKNVSGFKAPEKVVQPKAGRKPLGDLTNSRKPQAPEILSKKNCAETVFATVKKEKVPSFASGEGFLHNHDECIKAIHNPLTMSMDYFLETVALTRDSTASTTPQLPQLSKGSNMELELPLEIDDMEIGTWDASVPPSPPAPKSPRSPSWSMDFNNLEFSPLKLKESPVRI